MTTNSARETTQVAFDAFRSTLAAGGVREALAYLLSLTDYRFIAIFRFQNGMATAAVYCDRENPDDTFTPEVVDTATYCCYVRDGKGQFATAEALLDKRTEGHPARAVVPAYCGMPIMDEDGTILGTLCHYDLVPRDPQQVDLELMVQAAGTLALGGFVPRYPTAADREEAMATEPARRLLRAQRQAMPSER